MAYVAVGYGADRVPLAQWQMLLAGARRHWRRLRARSRLHARRAERVRAVGMLNARERADIGLPTSPPFKHLESTAHMFMMR